MVNLYTPERWKRKSIKRFFSYFFVPVIFVFSSFFLLTKPAFASQQIILRVVIPPKVVVTVEGETIQRIFSNIGRPPRINEIVWKDQRGKIVANDKLIRKFLSLSAKIDWQKAGIIYERQTILEKIVSLLL